MGTRIHKVLGYGFVDYTGKNDARFNVDWNNSDFIHEDRKGSFLEFVRAKAKGNKDAMAKFNFTCLIDYLTKLNGFEPYEWIHESSYKAEKDGCKRPLVFSHRKDWNRYNDPIDYSEKLILANPMKDSAKLLDKHYIYPYASYVDVSKGKKMDSELVFHFIRGYHSKEWKAGKYDNELSKKLGYSRAAFEQLIWPEVPFEIKMFAEWMNIFKNPIDVYKLRPMIYTYWD